MMSENRDKVVSLKEAQKMREHFLGWQCRLRQLSVREAGGRPTSGMKPRVSIEDNGEALGRITVVIIRHQPKEDAIQFSYIIRQTQDPVERYEKGLQILQAEYYQRPQEFSDKLTALFGLPSELAKRLLEAERCTLDFEQYNQWYHIPSSVKVLTPSDPAYQATYWHNHLFNPEMPSGVQVLAFSPDWQRTTAFPSQQG
jgi:hypothetical protein